MNERNQSQPGGMQIEEATGGNASDLLRKTQERLREALARLDGQIHEIAELQASFLPARFPPAGGLTFAAFCRPCTEIGGDYYDVFLLPDGRLCVAIADVTGHGARAAVLMAMTRSLTRAAASQTTPEDGPAGILCRVNGWLCDQLSDCQFVTMWMGVWDSNTAELRYTRAGHPAGILVPPGREPAPLSGDGVAPLGIAAFKSPPPEDLLRLQPDDRLFLFTDGWTESTDASGNPLMVDGLIQALKETDGLALESVPLAMYYHLERFLANASLLDDVSLLILERDGHGGGLPHESDGSGPSDPLGESVSQA